MSQPKRYLRKARIVEAMRWGPTYRDMGTAFQWLGSNGISARWDPNANFPPKADEGLPRLHVFNSRWDCIEVRIGDLLVLEAPRRIKVVPRDEFTPDNYSLHTGGTEMNVHILEHPAGDRIILADPNDEGEEALGYLKPNEARALGVQLIEAANQAEGQ
jgi:hypothetical protein